jgi:hypothetical protein
MTGTEAKWSERVREWRASGKTAEDFASACDFEASTLRYWASRLKTEAAKKQVPPMARVVRRRTGVWATAACAPESGSPQEVEVRIGEARIVVRTGFDAELLRQVALALGGGR